MVDQIAEKIKTEAYDVSNDVSSKVEHLRDYAQKSGERIQHWVKDFSEHANDGVETVESSIRSQPLVATAVAFAAGFLISKLFSSKK